MQNAYIQRWTEDPREDMQQVRHDNDRFYDGFEGTLGQGLAALAADVET